MSYIRKIANYISKISIRHNKVSDEKAEIDAYDEVEDKFATTVITIDEESIVNFKNLFNFEEDKEFASVIRMAKERDNIKSKYIFGEVKNLF